MADGATAAGGIWSSSDFPYMCLRDHERTTAFREAILATVRPGDVVVEVGAGTGIQSFFAAQAGAARVVAVEIDPLMAASLRRSARANGMDGVVEVIEGDALTAPLPRDADVVISEMIDTGLLDELQVPVINRLHRDGVIGPRTRVIPGRYTTLVQLVHATSAYYGVQVLAPKHDWPFYADDDLRWHVSGAQPGSDVATVAEADFRAPVPDRIDTTVTLGLTRQVNAVRLSGAVHLTETIELGPTPALNGDKIVFLDSPYEPTGRRRVTLRVRYDCGAGLSSLRATLVDG